MTPIWFCTITANVLLMIALVWVKGWRRFPIFFGAQAVVIGFEAVLAYAFYSPQFDQSAYHEAWMATDQICILLATVSAWEMTGKCLKDSGACIAFLLLFAHALMSMWDYAGDTFLGPSIVRVCLNIAITILLALTVYERRNHGLQR